MEFSNINLLSAFVAAVAGFLLGWIWYSLLFEKKWQSKNGFTDEYLAEGNMGKMFGMAFIVTFIMAVSMAMIIQGHDSAEINWLTGMTHGLYVGVGFMATAIGLTYIFIRKPFTVFLIDAGYQVVMLGVMGAILGAWG
jgi:hypothetical protein